MHTIDVWLFWVAMSLHKGIKIRDSLGCAYDSLKILRQKFQYLKDPYIENEMGILGHRFILREKCVEYSSRIDHDLWTWYWFTFCVYSYSKIL